MIKLVGMVRTNGTKPETETVLKRFNTYIEAKQFINRHRRFKQDIGYVMSGKTLGAWKVVRIVPVADW